MCWTSRKSMQHYVTNFWLHILHLLYLMKRKKLKQINNCINLFSTVNTVLTNQLKTRTWSQNWRPHSWYFWVYLRQSQSVILGVAAKVKVNKTKLVLHVPHCPIKKVLNWLVSAVHLQSRDGTYIRWDEYVNVTPSLTGICCECRVRCQSKLFNVLWHVRKILSHFWAKCKDQNTMSQK